MGELINGRRPEEIRNALCVCTNGGCSKYRCAYEEDGDCSGSVMRDSLELIKRLESERDAALAKVPRWISVVERLPEAFVSVLVQMPGEVPHPTVREGFISPDGIWCAGHFRREPDEVTHWAKMPEPPKEGE